MNDAGRPLHGAIHAVAQQLGIRLALTADVKDELTKVQVSKTTVRAAELATILRLSLIHISEPTRLNGDSRLAEWA